MPYTAPKIFKHGDFPLAADFNAIKDSLDTMHVQSGDQQVNSAVCYRRETVQGFYFVHKCPFLIYLIQAPETDGSLEDPAGVGETVSLPGPDAGEASTGYVFYDLSTVEWLFPGKIYQVQGVTTCLEDYVSL